MYIYIYIYISEKCRFRVHKSDVNAGKDRCGVAKHFLTRSTHSNCSSVAKLKPLKFN